MFVGVGPLEQETAKLFHETFAKLCGGIVDLSKHPSEAAIAEQLNPAAFAIKADKISYSVEPAVGRFVRLGFNGHREIYTAPAWSVMQFLAGDTKVRGREGCNQQKTTPAN